MPKVNISSDAKLDLIEIENYLVSRWSEKTADHFYEKLLRAVEILESGHVIFERYENTRFRKFLLTKHNYIIYDQADDLITIVSILKNFKDPEENFKDIIGTE